jgi:hypothetical protein
MVLRRLGQVIVGQEVVKRPAMLTAIQLVDQQNIFEEVF